MGIKGLYFSLLVIGHPTPLLRTVTTRFLFLRSNSGVGVVCAPWVLGCRNFSILHFMSENKCAGSVVTSARCINDCMYDENGSRMRKPGSNSAQVVHV